MGYIHILPAKFFRGIAKKVTPLRVKVVALLHMSFGILYALYKML
jgi:hypothetical protein